MTDRVINSFTCLYNLISSSNVQCHNQDSKVIARVHPVHTMKAGQCQMAADLCTKPTDFSQWPACRQLWSYIHHCHSLLFTPKADTHFTVTNLTKDCYQRWHISIHWLKTALIILTT